MRICLKKELARYGLYVLSLGMAGTLGAAPLTDEWKPENTTPEEIRGEESLAPADTTGQKRKPVLSAQIDFDPTKVMYSDRYIAKGDSFKNRFRDHFSVGFVTGIDMLVPRGKAEPKPYMPIGVTVGYDFSKLHTLRLTGHYATFDFRDADGSVEQWGVDVDYMFKLSSYLNGYNRRRLLNVSPVIGLGYVRSQYNNETANVIKGQFGVNVAVSLGRNARFFVEPFCAATSDKIDFSESSNLSKFDILYGARAGLSVNLDNSNDYYDSEVVYTRGFFYELAQGITFATSGDIGFINSLGTGYRVSVGRWFDPIVGLRVSAGGSESYWSRGVTAPTIVSPSYEEHYKSRMFSGRVEGLVNPLNFNSLWRQMRHPFEINVAVGGEFGWLMKRIPNTPKGLKCNYSGFTAAVSCMYNLDKETALFIEPRVLVSNFKEPYVNVNRKASFTESSMSVYAGVRVCTANRKERASWPDYHFEKRLFSGIQVGGLKHMQAMKEAGDYFPSFSGTFYVGYHLARMVTLKSAIEYMTLSKNGQTPYTVDFMGDVKQFSALYQYRYGMLNFKLSYMLNLSNVYQKYDLNRKFHVYAEAGAMWAMCRRQGMSLYSKEFEVPANAQVQGRNLEGKGSPAAFLGVVTQYKLNKRWSLIVEPEVQYYFRKDFFGGTTVKPLNDVIVKLNVGTSYTF